MAHPIRRQRPIERVSGLTVSLQTAERFAALFQRAPEQRIVLGQLEPEQVVGDLERLFEGAGGEARRPASNRNRAVLSVSAAAPA